MTLAGRLSALITAIGADIKSINTAIASKLDKTDSRLPPVGTPMPWLVTTIPTGYLEFNGQAITAGAYPKLYALFGGNLPDLRDKMLLGASATYDIGTTGGEATHLLTGAESGIQTHSLSVSGTSGGISANHYHSGSTGGRSAAHTHAPGAGTVFITGGATSGTNLTAGTTYQKTSSAATGTESADHSHAFTTGYVSSDHTHTTSSSGSVAAANALAAHNNLPPYRAVKWITVAG